MTYFIVRRLIRSIVALYAVTTLVFLLVHFSPGDPVRLYLGHDADPAALAQKRHELGLDRPLPVQYVQYIGNVLQGDLGRSIFSNQPVSSLIANRAPVTLELALITLLFASITAIALGVRAAARRGSYQDGVIRVGSVLGISLPNFWIGLMLILVVGLYVPGILPPGGWVRFRDDPIDNLYHVILPALVLGLPTLAVVTRTVRSSMLDALARDYVVFSRSMGLPERRVLRSVALSNAIIPASTVIGLALGHLVSGAVIIENVFTIPGVGQLMVDSFKKQDYPVAIGGVLFSAVLFIAITFMVDILYAYLNPRIRDLYVSRVRFADA